MHSFMSLLPKVNLLERMICRLAAELFPYSNTLSANDFKLNH